MAIVFASISGIAGREAISNFVHRFLVPRSTSYGVVYRAEDSTAVLSGSVSRDLGMSERHNWQKLNSSVKTEITANVQKLSH